MTERILSEREKELAIKQQSCSAITCQKSHVYFIKETTSNNFKIGFSGCVQQRLKSLQVGNSRPLEIVTMFHGARLEEQFLHNRYRKNKIIGEWYSFPPGSCFLLS